jgi:NADP-dependent 3-hydroxy acid dehydrogenase YdfG
VDVTDRQAVAAAIAEAEKQFGPVDAMINNAGVMLLGNVDSQAPDEWEQMLAKSYTNARVWGEPKSCG